MKRIRTDREILRVIHDRYYDDFVSYERDPTIRQAKNLIPIDIPALVSELKMDKELIFGRLYYHLAPKHTHREGQTKMSFFEVAIRNESAGTVERHLINFPMLEAALASLEYEERKFRLPLVVSSVSLGVSILALAANVAVNWPSSKPLAVPATAAPASKQ